MWSLTPAELLSELGAIFKPSALFHTEDVGPETEAVQLLIDADVLHYQAAVQKTYYLV